MPGPGVEPPHSGDPDFVGVKILNHCIMTPKTGRMFNARSYGVSWDAEGDCYSVYYDRGYSGCFGNAEYRAATFEVTLFEDDASDVDDCCACVTYMYWACGLSRRCVIHRES